MTPILSPLAPEDRTAVLDLFNYYVENSFAAYPAQPLPAEAFDFFLESAQRLPVLTLKEEQRLLGFGMLTPFEPFASFDRTAEVVSFLQPHSTGQGLGSRLLQTLETCARDLGIRTLLANISSLNPRSIKFHRKHGYVECGRFRRVGYKLGQEFDVVYMQKRLV